MNKIVENNKIKTGFKVPENYFENLSSELFSKCDGDFHSSILPKKSGFIVPEDYFSENENKLFQLINNKKVKIISLKPKLYWITSIAAILLIVIMLPLFYHTEEITKTEWATQNYLELQKDELSEYEVGVMLDNEDIESLENELIYNNLK